MTEISQPKEKPRAATAHQRLTIIIAA